MLRKLLLASSLLAAAVPAAVHAQAAADAPVLDLPAVLRLTEERNPNLAALREKVLQADANLRRAWATVLPKATITGSITRNSHAAEFALPELGTAQVPNAAGELVTVLTPPATPPEPIELQPLVAKALVAQASMPLVVMPAYFGILNAKQAVELTQQSVSFGRSELMLGVTQAYYGAVATRRLVELAEKQLETAVAQERLAQARYQAGQLTRVGPLRAQVERSAAEQDLRRAESAHALAKLALAQLAGLEGEFAVADPPAVAVPEATGEELLAAALAARKDLAASRSAAEIADRALTAAWWQFAPVLAASGQWMKTNSPGFTGNDETWAATVAATFTVYDGGARYGDLDAARSQRREAAANLEASRRQVETDVKAAVLELDVARANALTARERAKLAEEVANLVQAQFEAGAATSLDLVDATTTRFAASVGAITEELNVDVAALKLQRAIGRYDPVAAR